MVTPQHLFLGVTLSLLLALPALQAGADPCTLYKPRNIALAKANIQRHAWAQQILAGWQRGAELVLGKDRDFLRQMVPDLTPWSPYGQVCPACVGTKCSMGETGVWEWSLSEPDKLRCRYCKTEYPNEQYPETGVLDCPKMGQSFTYYINEQQRAHPNEDLGKHAYLWAGRQVQVSFSGVIRHFRLSWATSQVPQLAKLYALTGDVRYAERTAWLLERLAEVFPRYLYHGYGGVYADCDPAEAAKEMGRNPHAGKFPPDVIRHPVPAMRDRNRDGFGDMDAGFWGAGRFFPGASEEGLVLFNCVWAYDLTREAKYADGQPVYTPQMSERITRDLLLAGCGDMENYREINNKCGPGRALSGAVGILFGQPERVRRALDGFERLLDGCFHFDGFCRESPSYSSMHLGLMEEIPDLLAGYSDPPGYQPEQGERFDDFDPFQRVPRYRLALESMVRMLRPDLKFPVIGDTHAGGGTDPHFVEILAAHYGQRYAGLLQALQRAPLDKKGSEYALWHRDPDLTAPEGAVDAGLRTEYFPGWQVGVLRAGKDDTKTSFCFNGYSMHGHRHDDTLGVIYHAYDTELASDRGYIWDDPRNAWTKSTLSHNLVAVDGQSQIGGDRHSTLELFGVTPGIEVIQASANAYKQCSQYRRTCALVRLPEGGNYVVDIFRVTGGKLHQYCFNANGRFLGLEGAQVAPIEGKLSWLTNLRAATPGPDTWHATWDERGVRMRLFMAGPLSRLLVTDAPGWRSYKGDQLNAPPITQIVAERAAQADLDSAFVAVMAPFKGEAPLIRSVRRLDIEGGSVGVAVDLGNRTDYVLSSLDDASHDFGPLRLTGRFAFASVDATGRLLRAYLLDGTDLVCGERTMHLEAARVQRKVVKAEGSEVTLEGALTGGNSLVGSYLLTGGTGFEVAGVEGERVTVRDFPFVGGGSVAVPNAVWVEEQG